MKKTVQVLEKASRWLVGLSMTVVVAAMAMQVFYRYILVRPLAWTETVTKFAFVYCVFFGAFIGVRRGMHVVLDKIPSLFPPPLRLACTLLINTLIIATLAVSAYYGYLLFQKSLTSLLPALNVPLGWIYLPFAVSCVFTILSYLDLSLDALRAYGGKS
ncbi:MAG: TRAP transporter small permease [Planctomycetes bacterium]|nr:TRAP transporter small permease [Planctomycetota bacterium]